MPISLVASVLTAKEVFKRIVTSKDLDQMRLTDAEMRVLNSRGSLTNILSSFIIEPTLIVSKSLDNHETTEKLLSVAVDIFTGYYVQVYHILTNVHKLSSSAAFDLLSSSTGYSGGDDMSKIAFEEHVALPLLSDNSKFTIEATTVGKRKDDINEDINSLLTREIMMNVTVTKENGGTHTIGVPVTIKAHIRYTDFTNILNVAKTEDVTATKENRVDSWRAGATSLKNLIFASDLITKYKEGAINDTDDVMKLMVNRERTANIKLLTSGAVGFGLYYNMFFVSSTEATLLESFSGGSFKNKRYREHFLKRTKSLSLFVVDIPWEKVTAYTIGLSSGSKTSFSALKRKSKHSGDDMSEILKALIANKPPVI